MRRPFLRQGDKIARNKKYLHTSLHTKQPQTFVRLSGVEAPQVTRQSRNNLFSKDFFRSYFLLSFQIFFIEKNNKKGFSLLSGLEMELWGYTILVGRERIFMLSGSIN
ncbi:hypothetical protein IW20_11055 [Flavobacterium hydatis]|uniref:Uncharacterized protein n=1 Tax=Flavobacterium hydatis TaxID=991 RepID=A0A086AHY2_FLAHY|nr:hypothetical protein IW20_11055 [Flavobacterium hydatis]